MSRGLGRVQRELLAAIYAYDDLPSRSCLGTSAAYLAADVADPTGSRWATETEARSVRRALGRLVDDGYLARLSRLETGWTYELTDKGRAALPEPARREVQAARGAARHVGGSAA